MKLILILNTFCFILTNSELICVDKKDCSSGSYLPTFFAFGTFCNNGKVLCSVDVQGEDEVEEDFVPFSVPIGGMDTFEMELSTLAS